MSLDGISAFDLISRKSMLEGLCRIPGGEQVLPFVRMFYGSPSVHLWEDDSGVVHHIRQGEGGDQGDPLMPLLYSLGQHTALVSIQEMLRDGERLFAFHDDLYVVTVPNRVGAIFAVVQECMRRDANIRVHLGKIKVWNAGGIRPRACDVLQQIAEAAGSRAPVWRGSGLPTAEQGIKVLGTPLGHEDFVAAHLSSVLRAHQILLERIPLVQDVQCAWALLLHSAAARANYQLRVVRPELTSAFAQGHDDGIWSCLCQILHIDPAAVHTRQLATLPLSLGGLGLRSAIRTKQSAYWASWADSLGMLHNRHSNVADAFLECLTVGAGPPSLVAAHSAREELSGVMGFEPPSWHAVLHGARPPFPDEFEPGSWRTGWQHEAASRVERHHREHTLMPVLSDSEKALLRSQSGPFSGAALSATPSSFPTRIPPHLFRVLLLRRLRLPLPPTVRTCRCGRQLDSFGHHRAACAQSGLLARRGFAVENAVARVCREAGARVSTNVMVRDLDLLAPQALDGRRLEVVAEGLPLFGGMQLAIDATLVSPLHCDGTARPGAAHIDGVALQVARRRKERTYPELVFQTGRHGW